MKKLLPMILGLVLLGAGCGSSPSPSPAANTPKASDKLAAEKKADTLAASMDRKVSPPPACEDVRGIKAAVDAGNWVANDDRGISKIFPALPATVQLCGHFKSTKIIMYASGLSPNEGIAYYKEKLEAMGFTVENKNSIFQGVGYLNARKTGVATVNFVFDGNDGFMSFNYVDNSK